MIAPKPRVKAHGYKPGVLTVQLGKREIGTLAPSGHCETPWSYTSAVYHFAGGQTVTRAQAVRDLVALDARIVRPASLSLDAPIESFRSPRGRRFVLADATVETRSSTDPLWSHDFAVYLLVPGKDPKRVGTICRSWTYGITKEGQPRWCGSLSWLRWVTTFDMPRGCGYDVAAFDDPESCVRAWARSADEILDHVKDKVA